VNLMGPVELGHIFVVAGLTSLGCKHIKVMFSDGEEDIPMNILVDMTLKQLVINSYERNQWTESIKADTDFLGDQELFKFYLLVSDSKIHISLNDRHLVSFQCRSMMAEVKNIKVFGDLEQILQVDHRKVFPSPWPPVQEDLPTIAFSSDFPYQFLPGSVVVLRMRVSGSPKGSFFIRFNEFGSRRQLFHLSTRFNEKAVVVNSMNDSLE
jgi:Galactoside-binding lectin